MGNSILLFVIVISFIAIIISIIEQDFRKIASAIACFCLLSCILHYYMIVRVNKNYIDTVYSSNINKKIELFNDQNLNKSQKEQLIYSIANNLQNLSLNALKTVLIDNKNEQIIELFFKKLQERGFFFSEEQLELLIVNAIKDKNAAYRKNLFPSSVAYEKVLKLALNMINSYENEKNHIKLKETMLAFPELFNKEETHTATLLSDTYQKTLDINNGTSKNIKEFDELTNKKNLLEKQVMAFPLNWTLRGTVKESGASNGIFIANATLEGNSIGECILKTDKSLAKDTQIEISVKDDGQCTLESADGKYATYRIFTEDYSSSHRNELNKQIIEINEKLASSGNLVEADKSNLETSRMFIKVNLDALKKAISLKVKQYEL